MCVKSENSLITDGEASQVVGNPTPVSSESKVLGSNTLLEIFFHFSGPEEEHRSCQLPHAVQGWHFGDAPNPEPW